MSCRRDSASPSALLQPLQFLNFPKLDQKRIFVVKRPHPLIIFLAKFLGWHSCQEWWLDTTVFPWKQSEPLQGICSGALSEKPEAEEIVQVLDWKTRWKGSSLTSSTVPDLPCELSIPPLHVTETQAWHYFSPFFVFTSSPNLQNNTKKQTPYRVKHGCPSKYRVLLTCLILHKNLQRVLWKEPCAGGAGLTNKAPASSCYNSLLIKKSVPKIPLLIPSTFHILLSLAGLKG